MTQGLTRRNTLTGATLVGIGLPTLAACGDDSPSATDSESPTPDTPTPETPAPEGGEAFTTTADIPEGGGAIFADDGVVVTQPAAGDFKGFTNICTHKGCPVAEVTDTINCKCHGSMFSIEDGSVVGGPATAPLAAVDISVTGEDISKA